MISFVSQRERRLWAWTLAAVAAVYASVGLARSLSDELRNRGLLDDVFFAAFLVLVAAVIFRALSRTSGRDLFAEVFAVLATALVHLMLVLRMASPLERSHMLEYGVIALLIHEALSERASHGAGVRYPAPAAVAAASLLGAVDEFIQLLVPSRVFDPVDMGFNVLAAGTAVGASLLISSLRRGSAG